jgi:hypothetical protein
LALVRNEPALVTAAATAASFGIVTATFCSLQELCRLLRQDDGAANSLAAGAGSGALLRGLHHGRQFALAGALLGGVVGCVCHVALDSRTELADAARPLWHMIQYYSPVQRLADGEVERREKAVDSHLEDLPGGNALPRRKQREPR